jgi:carbon monoxide dehydrogenase subunit G
MASIRKEILIDAPPQDVWAAVRDFGALHERLVPGFVVDTRLDGDVRAVTFFNGAVARERLVAVDDQDRRLAYTVIEGPLGTTHHNASAQVIAQGAGRSVFVWVTDVLPDDVAPNVADLMERGISVIKQTLESEATRLYV